VTNSGTNARALVAIAQTNPVLGDLAKNLESCAALAEKAAAGGARLILFPELAATGYFIKDMVPDVALRRDDGRLKDLLRLSKKISIVLGAVEESPDFVFYNSAFYMEDGELRAVHRKVYLPTYGLFDEARYLAPGSTFRAFDSKFGRVAILICEDAWHISAPYIVVQDGAQMILSISASPMRGMPGGSRPVPADAWEDMNRTYARLLGVHFLYANRIGYEDGIGFWGGSEIIAPDGAVVAKGPYFEESVVAGEIDPRAVRRARLVTPLFRDERMGLTIRELTRILNEKEARE
jgi:predicted amidohydrolase